MIPTTRGPTTTPSAGERYTGLYDGIDVGVDDSGGELHYELFVRLARTWRRR